MNRADDAASLDGKVSPVTFALLRLLVEGKFHSGEMLAQRLGISRTSVSNALRNVDALGLVLYSVRGKGYCLPYPPQWMQAEAILFHLKQNNSVAHLFKIEILERASSTNTLLLQRAKVSEFNGGAPSGTVLAAEWQAGGRGRLGRRWHSGLGNALTFSLLWRFECGLSGLSGLSLAVGVALIRALKKCGIQDVYLKWPNDVLAKQSKLAGILLEAQGDMLGPSAVVIGIGMNIFAPQNVQEKIGQPIISLAELVEPVPERNQLLAIILGELQAVLQQFSARGFAALREEWQSYHALQGQEVTLTLPDGSTLRGTARGVNESGALLLETAHGIREMNAGEINVGEINVGEMSAKKTRAEKIRASKISAAKS